MYKVSIADQKVCRMTCRIWIDYLDLVVPSCQCWVRLASLQDTSVAGNALDPLVDVSGLDPSWFGKGTIAVEVCDEVDDMGTLILPDEPMKRWRAALHGGGGVIPQIQQSFAGDLGE